jgi:hypothetical protein
MAGPVIADLEVEGVVEAPLERFGQGPEDERELWHSRQQVGVIVGVSWCGGLELGEFFGAGPVLGGQLSEAPLDALPVLLVGLGIAGVVLLLKPGDEVLLAALDIADQRVQPRLACGPGVVVVPAVADGELGAQQVVTARAEDALGEEGADQVQEGVFADPDTGRMSGVPAGPAVVVVGIGLAGIVGVLVAGLAERADGPASRSRRFPSPAPAVGRPLNVGPAAGV